MAWDAAIPDEPIRLKSFLMSFMPDLPLRLHAEAYQKLQATGLLSDPQISERVQQVTE